MGATGGHIDDKALQSKLGCLVLKRADFMDAAATTVLVGSDVQAPAAAEVGAGATSNVFQPLLDTANDVLSSMIDIAELQDANLAADLMVQLLYFGSANSTVNGSVEVGLKGLNSADAAVVNALTSPDALLTFPITTFTDKVSKTVQKTAGIPGVFANDEVIQVAVRLVTKPTTANIWVVGLRIFYERQLAHPSGVRQVLSN